MESQDAMHRPSSTGQVKDSREEHKFGPKEVMQAILAGRRSMPGHAAMMSDDRAPSDLMSQRRRLCKGHLIPPWSLQLAKRAQGTARMQWLPGHLLKRH